MKYLIVVCLVLASTVGADARRHPRAAMRGYTCGLYQRQHYDLPTAFNLARHWLTLRRTDAHPGAVVVFARRGRALGGGPGGHVVRIVEVRDRCSAMVNDNRGTYMRNICKNQLGIVEP